MMRCARSCKPPKCFDAASATWSSSLILTGQRLNQIVTLERSWVFQLQGRRSRMRTSRNIASTTSCFSRDHEEHERHTIPFGALTNQVLTQVPGTSGSRYYFPADDYTKPFTNYSCHARVA